MKTLYLTDCSANIAVDKDNDSVCTLQNEDHWNIRQVFYIEEPMHVVYESGEKREEIDAKKGEILLVFQNNRYNKYILDTIRTKQWVKNINNRRKLQQKEKEEWAKKQAESAEKCDCADSCGNIF